MALHCIHKNGLSVSRHRSRPPNSAWLRLRRDTFDRLLRYKGRHAVTSWDEAVDRLLDEAAQAGAAPADAAPADAAPADAAPAREVQPA